jgi:hypothetical protein
MRLNEMNLPVKNLEASKAPVKTTAQKPVASIFFLE